MPVFLLTPSHVSIKPAVITVLACFWIAHLLAGSGLAKIDSQRPRLGCFDGLRGYLALGVALCHYTMGYNYLLTGQWVTGSAWYTLMGGSAVAIFFMITGFIFWHRFLQPEQPILWGKFFVGRFFRLTPVYWISMGAVLIVMLILKQVNFEYSLGSILRQIVPWLFYFEYPITGAFPSSSPIAVGATWTLKYEWIFYLSLPIWGMIFKLNKIGRNFLLAAAAAAVVFFAVKTVAIPGQQINAYFFIYFLFGVGAAYLYQNRVFRKMSVSKMASLVALCSLAILFRNYENPHAMPQSILLAIFFIPICMGNSLFGLLKFRASLLLGEISYSIYLLHGVFLYVTYLSLNSENDRSSYSSLVVWGGMVGFGVVTVLFSLGCYLLIERPCIRLGQSISRK